MKRSMVAAGLLAGCIAFSAGMASASTVEAPTVIKKFKLAQDSSGRKYSGRIDSAKSRCKKARRVKVILRRSRNQTVVASDKTNRRGKFKVVLAGGTFDTGKYYMKVKKGSYKKGGDKVLCGKAQSPPIEVS